MGFYNRHIMPRIVHFSCGLKPNMRQREKVVPRASGRVLEVGIGSGLNLGFYAPGRVTRLWGLDPSMEMWRLARDTSASLPFDFEFIEAGAEDIPLESNSVDSVVLTYTLCTIPEAVPALEELRRVLKTDGRLLFCEHGLAPDPGVRKWQNRLNPLWRRFGGGCNLNRDIPNLLRQGGFRINDMETMYIPGWRPASFNFWGSAA